MNERSAQKSEAIRLQILGKLRGGFAHMMGDFVQVGDGIDRQSGESGYQ